MAKFKVYDKYDCFIRSFHSYEAAFNFLTINQRYNWLNELGFHHGYIEEISVEIMKHKQ